MTDINIRELANELSQLKDFKEKYLNIRNFFESKTSEIYEKLSEVEKNNDNLLKEIKSLLSEINPIIKFKPKSAKIKGLEIQHKNRGKVLISYGANPKTNLPKISEHIVQKDKIGEGIIIEIEEKKELQDSLPKKFSFMK